MLQALLQPNHADACQSAEALRNLFISYEQKLQLFINMLEVMWMVVTGLALLSHGSGARSH